MLGTLSETRETPKVSTTMDPSAIKLAETPKVDPKPIIMPQTLIEPLPEPTTPPTKEHLQDSSCTYCKAEVIITLAIRGSFVLVLLALCFNLVKSAKQ